MALKAITLIAFLSTQMVYKKKRVKFQNCFTTACKILKGYEIVKAETLRENYNLVDFLHINLSVVCCIVHPLKLNIYCYSITKIDLLSNLNIHIKGHFSHHL